jgi:hypothetical protein
MISNSFFHCLDCVFNANNGSSSFYVSGCLEPVSNIGFSQITGIAVINTCLTILAFVYFVELLNLFPNNADSNNANNKQPVKNEIRQEQQQQYYNGGYYVYSNDPNQYYTYNVRI